MSVAARIAVYGMHAELGDHHIRHLRVVGRYGCKVVVSRRRPLRAAGRAWPRVTGEPERRVPRHESVAVVVRKTQPDGREPAAVGAVLGALGARQLVRAYSFLTEPALGNALEQRGRQRLDARCSSGRSLYPSPLRKAATPINSRPSNAILNTTSRHQAMRSAAASAADLGSARIFLRRCCAGGTVWSKY